MPSVIINEQHPSRGGRPVEDIEQALRWLGAGQVRRAAPHTSAGPRNAAQAAAGDHPHQRIRYFVKKATVSARAAAVSFSLGTTRTVAPFLARAIAS
jgi:hypothetical protein